MAYLNPISVNSPVNWADPANAIDGSISTKALSVVTTSSDYLIGYRSDIYCAGIRIRMGASVDSENSVGYVVSVRKGSSWSTVRNSSVSAGSTVEPTISINDEINAIRVYVSSIGGGSVVAYCYRMQFITPVEPSVTTNAATNIKATTAQLNGNITSTGGATVTTRGFQYKKGEAGSVTSVYDTGSYGTGSFNKSISSLDHSSEYYFRAYATNDVGTTYGSWLTFTTLKPPTVTTTTPPSAKDHESASLNGEVTDADGQEITEIGFEYKEGLEGSVLKEFTTGSYSEGVFGKTITGLKPYTLYYYRAYAVNASGTGYGDWESFTTDKTAPTVTVQAVTDILPTTATANGNITCSGGEDCSERGFQYGLTKVATWSAKDEVGGYEAGAYSKALTGLSANTTYWIRAYAVNTIGTGYSEWIQFQTAAAGIIPTGTKLNICSDYSGYTYKLMRAETDDGAAYTAYFVLSTDLANKQGLAYHKRILDLYLYLNSEDSGTVTISVKKDNETTWEELGSVSLVGDEDIIIRHLPVDVRAKHFLFKISATNHFEFLGVLIEFIPVGMR